MTRMSLPLDGERLFVAHCEGERMFAPSRHPAPTTNEDTMAAIACRHQPAALLPLRLLPTSPAGRRQPSAAALRRWAASALVAFASLGLLLGVGSLADAEQGAAVPTRAASAAAAALDVAAVHVVQPGDTLWTLARRVQPEGDVRPLVARLRARHGSGPLVPGERLLLAV